MSSPQLYELLCQIRDNLIVGGGGVTVDVEKFDYCNPATGTIWVRVCSYDLTINPPPETIISDTDTGVPCAAGTDSEFKTLCDDNGPFCRRIDVTGGIAAPPVDTLLDGVTPYATVGTVGACPVFDTEIIPECLQVTQTDWLIDNEQDNDCGSSSQPEQWAPDDPPTDYEITSFVCDGVETITGAPVVVAYPPTVAFTVVDPPAPTLGSATVTGDASGLLGQPINVFSMLPANGTTLIGQTVCTGAVFAAGETALTWAPPLPSAPPAGGIVQLDNVNQLFTNLAAALAALSGEAWVRTLHPTCANVVEVLGSFKQYDSLVMNRLSDGQTFTTNVAAQNVTTTRVFRLLCFEKDATGAPIGQAPVYVDYDDPTTVLVPGVDLTAEQIANLVCCPCGTTGTTAAQETCCCLLNQEECWIEAAGGATTAQGWTSFETTAIGATGLTLQNRISLENPAWLDITDPSPDNPAENDVYVTSNEDGTAGMFTFKSANGTEDFYYWDKDTGTLLGRFGFGALNLVGTAGFNWINSSAMAYDPVQDVLWMYALTSGGVAPTVDEVELISIDVSGRAGWGTDGSYDVLGGAGVLPTAGVTIGDVTNHGQIILNQPLSPQDGLRINGADGSSGFPGWLVFDHSTNQLYWASYTRHTPGVDFHPLNIGTHAAPITPTTTTGSGLIADVNGYRAPIRIDLAQDWSFPGTLPPGVRGLVISNGNVVLQSNALGGPPSYFVSAAEFVDAAPVDALQLGTDPLIRQPDAATEFPNNGTFGYWVNMFRDGQTLPGGAVIGEITAFQACYQSDGSVTYVNKETGAIGAPTGMRTDCPPEEVTIPTPEVVCCTPLCPIPLPAPDTFLAGYNNWWASGSGGTNIKGVDNTLYDVYAGDNGAPTGAPRTLCWRINELIINGVDLTPALGTSISFPVPTPLWRELLTAWVNTFIPGGDPFFFDPTSERWGFLTDPTMTFSITLQDGFDDHAGGCHWATEFHMDGSGAGVGVDWVVGAFNSQPMVPLPIP